MKTKEQILEHLENNGYDDFATAKILGYLLGANIVEKGEEILFHQGKHGFEDFFKWLNEEPKKNKFLDIATNLDYLLGFAGNRLPEKIEKRTRENVNFLMENKEYLQECLDKKVEAEAFLEDVNELLEGMNATLKSVFGK